MTIEVIQWIQSFRCGVLDSFFQLISFLGEQYVYILLLSIIYYTYDKKLGEFMGFVLFFTGIFNSVIKGLVAAQRPFQKYPSKVTNLRPNTSSGYSFPSGHTQLMSTFSFAGSFYFQKKYLTYLAITLSSLMALSRMYLGVHFLEDVLFALVLGYLIAFLGYKLFFKYYQNSQQMIRLYTIILIAFLPFVVILQYDDLFKTYGLMAGFTLAIIYEHKYVNFSLNVNYKKKVLRVLGGISIMLAIMIGFDKLFSLIAVEGSALLNYLDLIRYSLLSFTGIGLYPKLFKPLKI
jgi:hypothetical protein